MKIALLQPGLGGQYANQRQAYNSGTRPPETGLAVLVSWLRTFTRKEHEVVVLDPSRPVDDLVQEASRYNMLGMTDWFSNHQTVIPSILYLDASWTRSST